MSKDSAGRKRKRDQFSVTVFGIVIYSVILIAIVAGTYLGIKTFIKNRENIVADAVSQAEDEMEEARKAEAEKKAAEEAEAAKAAEEIEEPEPVQEEIKPELKPENLLDVTGLYNKETGEIDYSQTVAEPEKRNDKYAWTDTVFSKLENVNSPADSLVNTYDFSRKYAVVNGDKKLEFQIYSNPDTDRAEKITTKEYCGDDVEIISYYYDNGRINYVAQYRADVDLPVNLSTRDVQSRYYYSGDTLVKYIFCEGDKATEYNVKEIGSYSEGTVEQYDYLEKDMLNRAYINYNVVKLIDEHEKVDGYVLDEFNSGLNEVEIKVYDESDNEVCSTLTNGDGYYSFNLPVDNSKTYRITATKGTLDTVNVYNIKANKGSSYCSPETIYMAYSQTGAVYNVQILVRDAANAVNALPEAAIKLREGINNYDGDVIATGVLDTTGAIVAPLKAGCYTAEVQKGGFETCFFTVVVKSDHQAVLGYAVSDVGENEVKTILFWDSTPLDLDLRVFSSQRARSDRSGIDSVGSTMAEMIRTTNLGADTFECYVSDYSDCNGDQFSGNMSMSNAYIAIYSADGLQAMFHVPAAHLGVVWKPFEIRNARILSLNDYYYKVDQGSIWMGK